MSGTLWIELPVELSRFGGIVGTRIEPQTECYALVQIAYYEKPGGMVRFFEQRLLLDLGDYDSSVKLRLVKLQEGRQENKTLAELEIVHGEEKQSSGPKK